MKFQRRLVLREYSLYEYDDGKGENMKNVAESNFKKEHFLVIN